MLSSAIRIRRELSEAVRERELSFPEAVPTGDAGRSTSVEVGSIYTSGKATANLLDPPLNGAFIRI